ncbi:hypothetical protein QBC38DRAFT_38855 [Podospora fimiseda]|uniref:Transmembrane protein 42 n=1 Tax=Podospora fimiseda TaxID=252190 RepID=A0AAN7BI87_9PEZI|nr:hypothetical protein QBC38DRAFT_38855 [Podospora fimiseda]
MPTTRGQAKRHTSTEPVTATTKIAKSSSASVISPQVAATPKRRGRPPKRVIETPVPLAAETDNDAMSVPSHDEEHAPLLGNVNEPAVAPKSWAQRNQWIVFALASGACAAFNGVFAKLTTTELTTTLSLGIATLLGLEKAEKAVEIAVRGMFFGLNLIFNGVMWTLFTKALAKGNSTTQVSIMNTSFNFFITAILGFVIFSESLPPLWWLGASMLVVGNVIIGAKDESTKENAAGGADETGSISLSLADDEITALRGVRANEAVKEDEDVLQDLIVEEDD